MVDATLAYLDSEPPYCSINGKKSIVIVSKSKREVLSITNEITKKDVGVNFPYKRAGLPGK